MGTPRNLAVRQLTSGMDSCARSNDTKSLLPGRFSAAAHKDKKAQGPSTCKANSHR